MLERPRVVKTVCDVFFDEGKGAEKGTNQVGVYPMIFTEGIQECGQIQQEMAVERLNHEDIRKKRCKIGIFQPNGLALGLKRDEEFRVK